MTSGQTLCSLAIHPRLSGRKRWHRVQTNPLRGRKGKPASVAVLELRLTTARQTICHTNGTPLSGQNMPRRFAGEHRVRVTACDGDTVGHTRYRDGLVPTLRLLALRDVVQDDGQVLALEQFSKRMVPLVETRRVLSLLYRLNAEGSFLCKVHPFGERL